MKVEPVKPIYKKQEEIRPKPPGHVKKPRGIKKKQTLKQFIDQEINIFI